MQRSLFITFCRPAAGSYGIVVAAMDQATGQRVAIKKITNVFDHVRALCFAQSTSVLRSSGFTHPIPRLRTAIQPAVVSFTNAGSGWQAAAPGTELNN